VASSVSGRNLAAFFNQWVYQRGAPTYQYGWQPINLSGQNYLLVNVNQTQTATTGNPPQVLSVYEMPVDLSATINGNPTTLTIQNSARSQWYVIPVSAPVTAVSFDPVPYILRGAATSVSYTPGPPKIIVTAPNPGDAIFETQSPSQLRVMFHSVVNCDVSNFSLIGASTGPQVMTLENGLNTNTAILDLAGPLPPDTYTLTVSSAIAAINSGMALDGEVANANSPASLPSGDGVAGGDTVIQFSVTPCNAPGDIDANCIQDDLDAEILANVLLELDTDLNHVARSDIDGDGSVNGQDISAFIGALLNE
jgi:hypothetical protein